MPCVRKLDTEFCMICNCCYALQITGLCEVDIMHPGTVHDNDYHQ